MTYSESHQAGALHFDFGRDQDGNAKALRQELEQKALRYWEELCEAEAELANETEPEPMYVGQGEESIKRRHEERRELLIKKNTELMLYLLIWQEWQPECVNGFDKKGQVVTLHPHAVNFFDYKTQVEEVRKSFELRRADLMKKICEDE